MIEGPIYNNHLIYEYTIVVTMFGIACLVFNLLFFQFTKPMDATRDIEDILDKEKSVTSSMQFNENAIVNQQKAILLNSMPNLQVITEGDVSSYVEVENIEVDSNRESRF